MTISYTNTEILTLADLKKNLRIASTALDDNLELLLRGAVAEVENYIGRELAYSEVYDYDYDETSLLPLPRYLQVDKVLVGDKSVSYYLQGRKLTLEGVKLNTPVKVTTKFRDDIRVATLLIASAHFSNPTDAEAIVNTNAQRLLRPYRQYSNGNR